MVNRRLLISIEISWREDTNLGFSITGIKMKNGNRLQSGPAVLLRTPQTHAASPEFHLLLTGTQKLWPPTFLRSQRGQHTCGLRSYIHSPLLRLKTNALKM